MPPTHVDKIVVPTVEYNYVHVCCTCTTYIYSTPHVDIEHTCHINYMYVTYLRGQWTCLYIRCRMHMRREGRSECIIMR